MRFHDVCQSLFLRALLGAAALMVLIAPALAQSAIVLGESNDTVWFESNGNQTINAAWQTCGALACTMSGSASGSGTLQSEGGTYVLTAPNANPFSLVAESNGAFAVSQSAAIGFQFQSPQGTLNGTVQFTSVSPTNGSDASELVGTLAVTGGSFAGAFAGGNGQLQLNLSLGGRLADLVGTNHTADQITSEINYPSQLTPAPACVAASSNSSNFNGTAIAGGNYIWFNANLSASGMQDGTVIQFTNSAISFSANGTPYRLTAPNGTITFTSQAQCVSTSFDNATETWQTTVPLSGDDEIFLSGLAFPVPAGGLPGGINPVSWSGDFSTNTPGVSLQWKWGAAVYSSFTTNYNALGVKAGHQHDCNYNNGDHAGTPENFKKSTVGGARGGGAANATGSWSGTQSVTPCFSSAALVRHDRLANG